MRKATFLAEYNRKVKSPITKQKLGDEGFRYASLALFDELAAAKDVGTYEIPAFMTKSGRTEMIRL